MKQIHFENSIKTNANSEGQSFPCPPRLTNPLSLSIIDFPSFFQRAWEFLYGKDDRPFDANMHHFLNLNKIAGALWKDGKSAAVFFSREQVAFSSKKEAHDYVDFCDEIISKPNELFRPVRLWECTSKILQVLLLQVLQKIVEDCVSRLVEYMKPLLASEQKTVS